METLLNLLGLSGRLLRDGWSIDWPALRFARGDAATVAATAIAVLAAVAWIFRRRSRHTAGRTGVLLPAVLARPASGPGRLARHLPAVLVVVGLPFVLGALADPYTTFVRQEATNAGRRILILLDASGSMGGGTYGNRFRATPRLNAKSGEPFYTAAAAAEYLVRRRIESGFQDLIGLIEFGDESYIVSPFSTDYENVLTSIRLISEPEEYKRFNDSGTKIAKAISQGIGLFQTFAFLKSAGNLMVLISDGEDTQVEHEGRSLDSILAESGRHRIPVYFIRTASDKERGDPSTNDELWAAAVEKTGGKLYAGANGEVILKACDEIDRIATGRIQYLRYSARIPQFPFFALVAALLWSAALVLWLLFRYFRKFP